MRQYLIGTLNAQTMKLLTIQKISRKPGTKRIDIALNNGITVHFGDLGVMKEFASRQDIKLADRLLQAAVKDILATDPNMADMSQFDGGRVYQESDPVRTR